MPTRCEYPLRRVIVPTRKELLNRLIDLLRDGSINRATFEILSKRVMKEVQK